MEYLWIISFFYVVQSYPVIEYEDDNVVGGLAVDLSYLGDEIYKLPDPEVGKRLESWNETHPENPEEFGEYAEGDILFPRKGRNGMVAETFRWKDGVVPYEISSSYTTKDREVIKRAMEIYKKYTCVSFRPKTSLDRDYITIVNGPTGCWSSVGRISGKQEVNLQSPYCTTKVGTPLHELMHAIGFLHEQNRFERDDYVTIAWQNIRSGHENNFNKADKSSTSGFGVPYDFRSVMHYSNTAFSTNGMSTIIPKDSSKNEKMGQRDGFSKGDITKINAMYKCPEKTASVTGKGSNTQSTSSKPNSESSSGNAFLSAASNFLNLFIK